MDFNHFLTSYMLDPSIGSKVHFQNTFSNKNLIQIKGMVEKTLLETKNIPEKIL